MSLVVIGSGPYAISLANKYQKRHPSQEITLVALQENTIFLPAAPRCIVDGAVERNVRPIRKMLNSKVTLVIGEVTMINDVMITYNAGGLPHKLKYGALVIATGATHSLLITSGDIAEMYESSSTNIASSEEIVFLGGGEVAVEAAGEIATLWPQKKVTIIHRRDQILTEKYNSKVRAKVAAKLKELGVNVLLNSTGDVEDDIIVVENKKGRFNMEVDCVVNTAGTIHGNCPPIYTSVEITDTMNFVVVDSGFATSVKNVFAIGDVAGAGGFVYQDQYLETIMHNIYLCLRGKWKTGFRSTDISPYKPTSTLSVGPKSTFGQTKLPLVGTWGLPSKFIDNKRSKDHIINNMPLFYGMR